MAGLNKEYLVLIESTVKTNNGREQYIKGTGYFITKDLVLTANHVLAEGIPEKIEVRLEVREPGQSSHWVEAEKEPVWKNEKLDAALIRVVQPISREVPSPDWGNMNFQQNQIWESAAYPEASSERKGDSTEFKTSGLRGNLYAQGGAGQGIRDLELGVEDMAKFWGGISGAPVFVGEKLAGIIKESLSSFEQRRLAAVPVELLLREPGFLAAIEPKWIDYPDDKIWVLILNPENTYPELSVTVQAAIRNPKKKKEIELLSGKSLDDTPYPVSVTDALESPGRLFQFIEVICKAPVMVFDVTDFEPAVMRFLWIRAVVRRGVTLTTTTKFPEENLLYQLPFNIQEAKLIDLSEKYEIESQRHPLNWIGSAIAEGLKQLKIHPDYLDLPAYNAVRCPEPKDLEDKALMLCSFDEDYKKNHWRYVSNKIQTSAEQKTLERMLDISSPRLVGLALYESIRWTSCCFVDWTKWRANVFFELGVRLACSETGPVCLIEEKEIHDNENGTANVLRQRQQLIRLLTPTIYKLKGPIDPFIKAYQHYKQILNNPNDIPLDNFAIAHNAVYQTIVRSYYWQQEPISMLPHEELVKNVQAQLSTDPQKQGKLQVLFSSNPEFAKEIRHNVQERWIAAWYYLKGRYPMEEFYADKEKRKKLIALGEEVTQALSKTPQYKSIYDEVNKVIDELDDLDGNE